MKSTCFKILPLFLLKKPSNSTFWPGAFRQEIQDSLKHDAFYEPHETHNVLYLFQGSTSPALRRELSLISFTWVQIILCLTKLICGVDPTVEIKLKQPNPLLHLPSHPSCRGHHPHWQSSELHVTYFLRHHSLQIVKLQQAEASIDLGHYVRLSGGSGRALWIFQTSPHQRKKGEEGGKTGEGIKQNKAKPKKKEKKSGVEGNCTGSCNTP